MELTSEQRVQNGIDALLPVLMGISESVVSKGGIDINRAMAAVSLVGTIKGLIFSVLTKEEARQLDEGVQQRILSQFDGAVREARSDSTIDDINLFLNLG